MNEEIESKVKKICVDAKRAAFAISDLDSEMKNNVLLEVAKLLKKNSTKIIKANQKDLKHAKENGLDAAKIYQTWPLMSGNFVPQPVQND